MDAPTPQPRLLARLSEASRSILLLGVLLYFFGFLTMSSYLARFGIASFDILNARFAVAGVLVLVPLMFVFWVAWQFAKLFPGPFLAQNRSQRLAFLFLLPTTASAAGGAFSNLFKLGTYGTPVSADALKYHPLATWDFVGHRLGSAFVTGYLVTVVAYVLFPTVAIYLLVATVRSIARRNRRKITHPTTPPTTPHTQQAESPQKPLLSGWRLRLAWLLEATLISYLVINVVYAYLAVANTLADFATIRNSQFDSTTMGYWLLLSISGFYGFLVAYDVRAKGFMKSFVESFSSPHMTASLFTVVIVPLLSSIMLFGSAIFPRISYTIGGGQPREVVLPENNTLGVTSGDDLFLLGESSQDYYFVVLRDSSARAIQISKAVVPLIITK
jgi:hypothetical protein